MRLGHAANWEALLRSRLVLFSGTHGRRKQFFRAAALSESCATITRSTSRAVPPHLPHTNKTGGAALPPAPSTSPNVPGMRRGGPLCALGPRLSRAGAGMGMHHHARTNTLATLVSGKSNWGAPRAGPPHLPQTQQGSGQCAGDERQGHKSLFVCSKIRRISSHLTLAKNKDTSLSSLEEEVASSGTHRRRPTKKVR